jgi:hypothetical protein
MSRQLEVKRPGRPQIAESEKATKVSISLYPDELAYLVSIHPKPTRAIRKLIKQARAADHAAQGENHEH